MSDSNFGPIGQLGYAVNSVDEWVDNFLASGVGPWWVFRDMAADGFRYNGELTKARFACAVSWSGPIMIEIIQPLDEEPSPYLDYLKDGKEGLQHTCYFPEDFQAACQSLIEKGYVQTVAGDTGGFNFNYFKKSDGTPESIEVGKLSEEVRKSHAELREVCATWDGTDPIRGSYDLL